MWGIYNGESPVTSVSSTTSTMTTCAVYVKLESNALNMLFGRCMR